jgi:hypothetical protein
MLWFLPSFEPISATWQAIPFHPLSSISTLQQVTHEHLLQWCVACDSEPVQNEQSFGSAVEHQSKSPPHWVQVNPFGLGKEAFGLPVKCHCSATHGASHNVLPTFDLEEHFLQGVFLCSWNSMLQAALAQIALGAPVHPIEG